MAIESINGAGQAQQLERLAAPTPNERAAEVAVEREVEDDSVEISQEARAAQESEAVVVRAEAQPVESSGEADETSARQQSEQEQTEESQSSGGDVNDLAALVNSGQSTNRGNLINTEV